jgi:hypothetical protein
MIRRATGDDIPAMVRMGREFQAMSPHAVLGEYDMVAVAKMFAFMISSEQSLLLTDGNGLIGGVMAPVYFAPGKWMMEESFWWAVRGGRELLSTFEKEARLMGADFVLLSTLENARTGAVDRVVSRMGYRPIERRYVKELV